jgi:predicted  nucleic acid-binding Zn-ribbon protein
LSAEDELSDVRGELSLASTVNQDLHQQLEALQSTIKTLEERSANSLRRLDNVIKAVETIRSALRLAVESDVLLDFTFDN